MRRMAKRKTHEEYVNELKLVNPDIVPIEKYVGALTPILHKCLIDGYEWYITPANALFGKGCPKCAGNIKKTHEEYIKEVSLLNPNIEVIEKYINAKTPILHICKIDNYVWKAAPTDILSGKGCPKCAGNLKFTHQEYVRRLHEINPNIIPLEEYANSTTKIMYECLIDGYKWKAIPNSTLRGEGCPKCGGKLKKTHEEYVTEVSLINQDIEVLDIYISAITPIRHKCKIDGYIWYARPDKILHGCGCPQCNESLGERKIRQWLNKHNIEYIYQHKFENCKDKYVLPFDFYIPNYNLCVEFDGIQHFEVTDFAGEGETIAKEKFEYTQKHDSIKNKYCENNDIKLLRIPYFKNIEEELNNFLFI